MAKKGKENSVEESVPVPTSEEQSNTETFQTQGTVERQNISRPQGEVLVSGADFWDFEEYPVFTGKFIRDVIRETDGKNAATNPNEKAGSTMGFLFSHVDLSTGEETGEETIIGNSFSIEKALKDPKAKSSVLWIEFLGKKDAKDTANGRPFNQFHIQTVKI